MVPSSIDASPLIYIFSFFHVHLLPAAEPPLPPDDAAAAAAAATAMVTEAVANPCPKEEDSLDVLGSTISDLCRRFHERFISVDPGNTKGGSITVLLTSCLTCWNQLYDN
jgi:hypothetical protein